MLFFAGLFPENSKRKDWKYAILRENRHFPPFLSPTEDQKWWRVSSRSEYCSYTMYRISLCSQFGPTAQPLPIPSLPVCQVMSNTHPYQGRNAQKQQQWITGNQPVFPHRLEKSEETAVEITAEIGNYYLEIWIISKQLRKECRSWGEFQVWVEVQNMRRKSHRRKGLAPCRQSKWGDSWSIK